MKNRGKNNEKKKKKGTHRKHVDDIECAMRELHALTLLRCELAPRPASLTAS